MLNIKYSCAVLYQSVLNQTPINNVNWTLLVQYTEVKASMTPWGITITLSRVLVFHLACGVQKIEEGDPTFLLLTEE